LPEPDSISDASAALRGGEREIRILVDGHGGDDAPTVVLDALEMALSSSFSARFAGTLRLGIVGLEEVILPLLQARGIEHKVSLVAATQVVAMCDSPSHALRRKKGSSIHIGAGMVRDGVWDAFVSAGNTGALMAISKITLRMLPGIDRPAIASMVPAVNNGRTLLLDAGANSECTSSHLVQFAIMGACYMQAAEGMKNPRVGLLNIGSEDIKGTDVIKLTSAKLAETELNYIGNVEGTDISGNDVDVVVCDGFVGNVALKTIEGTARFVADSIKAELTSDVISKTGALLARSALKRFKDKVNPSKYNGAPLLGLNGIVVKSHGGTDAEGFASAIAVAGKEVSENLTDHITESIQEMIEA